MNLSETLIKRTSSLLIGISAIVLIGLQYKLAGYGILAAATASAYFGGRKYFKEIAIVSGAVAILGVTPINTDIGIPHATIMFVSMWILLLVPYWIFRRFYHEKAIKFPFRGSPPWTKLHLLYFVIVVAIAYLFLPFYLVNSGVYQNWPAAHSTWDITKLFIGTNLLGAWDEFFFVCTILGIYRRHLSFWMANICTSMIFSSFLYDLGFRSYGIFAVIVFTLLQGLIYKQTKSLPFVVTIHLTFDLILFLALIHAHNPGMFDLFFTVR